MRTCVINVGLYRTGTTTLAKAATLANLRVFREFPSDLSGDEMKGMLCNPTLAISKFWNDRNGRAYFLDDLLERYDFLCDGWCPLLPFLDREELLTFAREASDSKGINVVFVATVRDNKSLVRSELHHWIVHDLEERCNLISLKERDQLCDWLHQRTMEHLSCLSCKFVAMVDNDSSLISSRQHFDASSSLLMLCFLPLSLTISVNEEDTVQSKIWSHRLSQLNLTTAKGNEMLCQKTWEQCLIKAGIQNATPRDLPLEGILVTCRVKDAQHSIKALLEDIERDELCRYMVVLALDEDEVNTHQAKKLIRSIQDRSRVEKVICLTNPSRCSVNEPFNICHAWHNMAEAAWKEGAAWVILFGDDVRLLDGASFHYRAIYRSFLDIQQKMLTLQEGAPEGRSEQHLLECFGCPWFHDVTFPGFPTFPVVGRKHKDIFGGLIPKHRFSHFINQDLDPYLQRLYLKFDAAPRLVDCHLINEHGGTNTRPEAARYERIPAIGWRDWVLDDIQPIREYLNTAGSNSSSNTSFCTTSNEITLIDVVVPTYRLTMNNLRRICSLDVPDQVQTTIIVIVDNPNLLLHVAKEKQGNNYNTMDIHTAAAALEDDLVQTCCCSFNDSSQQTKKTIRVRCNVENIGCCASRSRGIDESSAEYILCLDDDVIPSSNLLHSYYHSLMTYNRDTEKPYDLIGLVGLVEFPRRPDLPLKHVAVLMSYLTFMFEIANNPMYQDPAWGVTANLLFKRIPGIRFDTAYAKTGGGEDVDFCLRLANDYQSTALSSSDTTAGLTKKKEGKFRSEPTAMVQHDFWDGSVWDLSNHFFRWAIGDSALFQRFPSKCYRSWPNMVEFVVLTLPLVLIWMVVIKLYHSQSSSSSMILLETLVNLLQFYVLLFTADVVVDMIQLKSFQHRRTLLMYDRSLGFVILAHILANLYIIILECGRLYGHVIKRQQYANICLRFDWHCGRLPYAPQNFRQRELEKFSCFVFIVSYFVIDNFVAVACRG